MPAAVTEIVECSAFGPSGAAPGKTVLIQVFLHLANQAERVSFLAAAMDASAKLKGTKTLDSPVKRRARVDLVFSAYGLQVDEPDQSTVWLGEPVFCQFLAKIPTETSGQNSFPLVRVSVDEKLVGAIRFFRSLGDVSGGVFINYRREDAPAWARLIYERLMGRFGRKRVFFDVKSIELGVDFVEVLSNRIGDCDALVAIIGKGWLTQRRRQRRIDDPNDFVRIEIEAALTRKIPVVPVFVDGAVMPNEKTLPAKLKALARHQGIRISHEHFDSDIEVLTKGLALFDAPPVSLPTSSEPLGDHASYKDVFVSYASEDRKEVLKRVQMLGTKIFQDTLSLDPKDRWEKKLYKHIDHCDLFLLFWSQAAKDSPWVIKEAEYALKHQQKNPQSEPDFVPFILEENVLPPPSLSAHLRTASDI